MNVSLNSPDLGPLHIAPHAWFIYIRARAQLLQTLLPCSLAAVSQNKLAFGHVDTRRTCWLVRRRCYVVARRLDDLQLKIENPFSMQGGATGPYPGRLGRQSPAGRKLPTAVPHQWACHPRAKPAQNKCV